MRLKRATNPVCEFTNMSKIILLAFPHLFQLGEGYPMKSSISKKYFRHLARWYDGRFEDIYFVASLFYVQQRHEVAREVKAKVMNNRCARNKLEEEVFQPNFEARIQQAIKDPGSTDAKKLMKLFEYFITMGTSNVAFSPGHRRNIAPTIAAIRYYTSPYTMFNTFCPDVFFTGLALRFMLVDDKIADPSVASSDQDVDKIDSILNHVREFSLKNETSGFNPYELVPNRPIRSAMYFYRLVENVAAILWRCPLAYTRKKTELLIKREKGILGLMRSFSSVVEVSRTSPFSLRNIKLKVGSLYI